MKLYKNRHLVKVPRVPMLAIVSYYYDKVSKVNSDETARILQKGFEDGYYKCLDDLGIKEKDQPKGKREIKVKK